MNILQFTQTFGTYSGICIRDPWKWILGQSYPIFWTLPLYNDVWCTVISWVSIHWMIHTPYSSSLSIRSSARRLTNGKFLLLSWCLPCVIVPIDTTIQSIFQHFVHTITWINPMLYWNKNVLHVYEISKM